MAYSSIEEEEAGEENTIVPNWLELPVEITSNILQRLDTIDLLTSSCQVCPLWRNICKDPLMWRTINMTKMCFSYYHLMKFCRNAVDRSCGHLEEINIEYFATDDLLEYIVDCTGNLRCLRLAKCELVSNEGFIKVAKKLSFLEELEISSCPLIFDSFDVIGQCCPILKSLKYSTAFWYDCSISDDIDAFAIAKTMPGLRHLQLLGNQLTDDGLFAILDGCPLLESLDLRLCYCIHVSESLEKRCREKIKCLRLPCVDDMYAIY